MDVIEWSEPKSMEIIDGPGNCQYSLDINRIAAPLTSMLWPSANQPLAGEASVYNDNVGTKVRLVVAVR